MQYQIELTIAHLTLIWKVDLEKNLATSGKKHKIDFRSVCSKNN